MVDGQTNKQPSFNPYTWDNYFFLMALSSLLLERCPYQEEPDRTRSRTCYFPACIVTAARQRET